MLGKRIYWLMIAMLFFLVSCGDDDGVGIVERVNLLDFDFPQGDEPWDSEIEKIAEEWGMYIIYKDVDSTHLNRMWSIPVYNDPIYVCTTPANEDIEIYLTLVKEWLLGSLDKTKEEDRKALPRYLYIVNDLNDGNPKSQTYQNHHIRYKKDGLGYWSLSFTSEELESGLSSEIIHDVACSFSYPGLKVRFLSNEYRVSPEFAAISDYENEIGRRYYSLEEFKADNPYMPDYFYYDNIIVGECDKDIDNAYLHRGFAPSIGEDFKMINSVNGLDTYGAPTWMPWIVTMSDWGVEIDENPGTVAESVEERILNDFLNMVRLSMTYPENKIREMFPLDGEEGVEREGFQMINDKYDIVIKYMKTTYGVDLQKYAEILEK